MTAFLLATTQEREIQVYRCIRGRLTVCLFTTGDCICDNMRTGTDYAVFPIFVYQKACTFYIPAPFYTLFEDPNNTSGYRMKMIAVCHKHSKELFNNEENTDKA
jgi:hypothetical protein